MSLSKKIIYSFIFPLFFLALASNAQHISTTGNLELEHDGLKVDLKIEENEILSCANDNSGTNCLSPYLIHVKFSVVFTNNTGKNISMKSQMFNLNIMRKPETSISYNGCKCADANGASRLRSYAVPMTMGAMMSSTGAECLFPGERFVAFDEGWFHPFDVLEIEWNVPNNNPNSHYQWKYTVCDNPACKEAIKNAEEQYTICMNNMNYACAAAQLKYIISLSTGECSDKKSHYENLLSEVNKKLNTPTPTPGGGSTTAEPTCEPCWKFLVEYGRKLDLHINHCRGVGIDPSFTMEMLEHYRLSANNYFDANLALLDKLTVKQLEHLEMIQAKYVKDLQECMNKVVQLSNDNTGTNLPGTIGIGNELLPPPKPPAIQASPINTGTNNPNQNTEVIQGTQFGSGSINITEPNKIYGIPDSKTNSKNPANKTGTKKEKKVSGRVTGM